MNDKTKNILRKVIYGVLFLIMIISFIYLSEKYAGNSEPKVLTINDYYIGIKSDVYEVVRGRILKSLLKDGKNLIFIGSSTSPYSIKYIEELNKIIEDKAIDKVFYYDLSNDKNQRNSNYYEIRDLLNGYLTVTDDNKSNLLAPSFYILDRGEVKYYNTETVAMKNTDSIDSYWTIEREVAFYNEVNAAINKYYLNK